MQISRSYRFEFDCLRSISRVLELNYQVMQLFEVDPHLLAGDQAARRSLLLKQRLDALSVGFTQDVMLLPEGLFTLTEALQLLLLLLQLKRYIQDVEQQLHVPHRLHQLVSDLLEMLCPAF